MRKLKLWICLFTLVLFMVSGFCLAMSQQYGTKLLYIPATICSVYLPMVALYIGYEDSLYEEISRNKQSDKDSEQDK